MLSQLILALAGGAFAASLFSRREPPPGRPGQGERRQRFHPGHLLQLANVLQLDEVQRDQVKDILRAMHRFGIDSRWHEGERLDAVADALRADRFDRRKLDEIVSAQRDREAAARREIFDRIELFHAGLTSEQRALLQQHLDEASGDVEPSLTPG